jgi:tRNA (guanine-N7-)-methyltransferase
MEELELRQKLWALTSKIHSPSPLILQNKNFPTQIHLQDIFISSKSQYYLELGSGWCEVVIQLAKDFPDIGFIAMERKWDRLKRGAKLAEDSQLMNLRFTAINFQWFLKDLFSANSIDTILLNFPDPWPKNKHHKNRTIQMDFLEDLFQILKPGGRFLFATDHFGYARWTIRKLRAFQKFRWDSFEYSFQRPNLPISSFEKEKMELGKRIFYLERSKP